MTTTYLCRSCPWQPDPSCRKSGDNQAEEHTVSTGHPTTVITTPGGQR